MKLVVEQKALLKALSHVTGVVERRNTIPILSNVRIDAHGSSLTLTATDLDMEIATDAPAKVEATGSLTVPASLLYEIVRKTPLGAELTLTYSGEDPRLSVKAGRFSFKLPVLPAGDFPEMAAIINPTSFEMEPKALARLIDKARFAMSSEETRYYLNGLYLHLVDVDGAPKLRAVATDGHRLALVEGDAPADAAGMPGVIVPRKTIYDLRKLMDAADAPISIKISPHRIRFEISGAVLTSKVIDGSFPDYMRVIPRENPDVMVVDTDLFAAAADRVATISAEKSRSIRMEVETGKLTLTVRNMEAGQAVEEVEIDYDRPSTSVGLNARYCLDVASQVDGETMRFAFDGAASPVLITDPSDDSCRFVIMPLRV